MDSPVVNGWKSAGEVGKNQLWCSMGKCRL